MHPCLGTLGGLQGLDRPPCPLSPLAHASKEAGPSLGSQVPGRQTTGSSDPGGSPEEMGWEARSLSSIRPNRCHPLVRPLQPGDKHSLGWAGQGPAAHAVLSSAPRVLWPGLGCRRSLRPPAASLPRICLQVPAPASMSPPASGVSSLGLSPLSHREGNSRHHLRGELIQETGHTQALFLVGSHGQWLPVTARTLLLLPAGQGPPPGLGRSDPPRWFPAELIVLFPSSWAAFWSCLSGAHDRTGTGESRLRLDWEPLEATTGFILPQTQGPGPVQPRAGAGT